MRKIVLSVLDFLVIYGWKGVYAHFFPVHWTQDELLTHGGFDMLSINPTGSQYFTGTVKQHKKEFGR